jgi:hypothetical protein
VAGSRLSLTSLDAQSSQCETLMDTRGACSSVAPQMDTPYPEQSPPLLLACGKPTHRVTCWFAYSYAGAFHTLTSISMPYGSKEGLRCLIQRHANIFTPCASPDQATLPASSGRPSEWRCLDAMLHGAPGLCPERFQGGICCSEDDGYTGRSQDFRRENAGDSEAVKGKPKGRAFLRRRSGVRRRDTPSHL